MAYDRHTSSGRVAGEGQRSTTVQLAIDIGVALAAVVLVISSIWAYAGVGYNEQAFAILERSFEERRDRMVWLNVDPLLDPLRSDPRFTDLVRRIGLPTQGSHQQ